MLSVLSEETDSSFGLYHLRVFTLDSVTQDPCYKYVALIKP